MKIESTSEGGLARLGLSGRIDASTSGELDTAVDGVFGGGSRQIVFDLGAVSYVSSAGLRAFVRAAKKAKSLGGGIALFGLQAGVSEIFGAAGFDKIIPIASSAAEAQERLGA